MACTDLVRLLGKGEVVGHERFETEVFPIGRGKESRLSKLDRGQIRTTRYK